MDFKKRSVEARMASAADLAERHKQGGVTAEDAAAYVEEVRSLTDATSMRPASYFIDEGCKPEHVVEHFRQKILPQQIAKVERAKAHKERENVAIADAKRRFDKDPKNKAVK